MSCLVLSLFFNIRLMKSLCGNLGFDPLSKEESDGSD